MIIACDGSVIIDPIGERLYVDNMESFRKTSTYKNLFYSPARTEIWKKEFPDVYNMFDNVGTGTDSTSFAQVTLKNDAFLPNGNSIIDNVFISDSLLNLLSPDLGGAAKSLTEVSGNITRSVLRIPKEWFVDYDGHYFEVKKNSDLYDSLPNFDAPEFDKIGVVR